MPIKKRNLKIRGQQSEPVKTEPYQSGIVFLHLGDDARVTGDMSTVYLQGTLQMPTELMRRLIKEGDGTSNSLLHAFNEGLRHVGKA